MATVLIHELPIAGALTGAEILPVDDGNATVRTTIGAIRDGLAVAEHSHGIAGVSGLDTALAGKAPLDSPVFAGAVTAIGPVHLGGPAGAESFRAVPVQGAVNRLDVRGAAAGQIPSIWADGADSMVQLYLLAKGGAPIGFQTDRPAAPQVLITHTPSNSHWVTLTGGPAGGNPAIGSSSGRLDITAVPHIPSYTVATLPVATARGLVHVADGAGNRRLAVSDGASWRWPDGAAVS